MNSADPEYNALLESVLEHGRRKKNRTGVDTIGVFGSQAYFDLEDGFPLLTTKKMFFKGIVHELLWFIRGDTNIKYLVDNGVHIWDDNWFAHYRKTVAKGLDKDELIHLIKNDDIFARKWGDLGEGTYGGMWRAFPFYDPEGQIELGPQQTTPETWKKECSPVIGKLGHVDQLQKVIDKLTNSPDDRRIIVSAWHPYWVDHCALPPCHVLFHFNTEELTWEERMRLFEKSGLLKFAEHSNGLFDELEYTDKDLDDFGIPKRRLNCLLYQRSCDLFLGVPFNIASYALLTELVAHCVNMTPGRFIHTFGDLHIYESHLEQVKEQLSRKPFNLPTIKINPDQRDLFKISFEDIKLEGYESHPAIKAEMAV